MDAAAGALAAEGSDLALAVNASLKRVLELIAAGRGVREAGSGLNAASSELLVADALLTEAAALAAREDGGIEGLLRALDLDRLTEHAHLIDEPAK